jgi:hypothetical protein
VVTLGWPIRCPGQGTMQLELWTHALSLMCAQAKGTKENFNSLSKMPHVFKIKISVFQVMTAKRQKDSLPEFCYGFNKEFGFFFSSLGPLPKIKS